MTLDEFVANHLDIVTGTENAPAFLALIGSAFMNAN